MRGLIFSFLVSTFIFAQDNNSFEQIDNLLIKYDNANTPGMSIGIIEKGTLIYSKNFGLSTLEYAIKNSDSTVFSIGSIAKQFTSACIWSLIKESKLTLDDDIRLYLPEFPNYGKQIKIRHLLNHTSGIRNYHTIMYLSGFDYDTKYYNNQTVFDIACKQKGINNAPGEKVIYSNTNYTLLALIIERISKQSLDEYLTEKILEPLKMNQTFVRIEHNTPIKNKAVGYKKVENGFIHSSNNQTSYGAGSMGSTILDFVKWIEVLNGENQDFIALTKFLTTCETLSSGEKSKYARGVMVDNYKGFKTISHSGYGFGGQSQLITIPEKRISVVILTNLQSINPTPISYKILDILLNITEDDSETTKNQFKINDEKYSAFIGDFKEINSDMKMKIFIENDTLKALGRGKNGVPLKIFDDNKFYRLNSQSVKYDFTKTKTHDLVITFAGTPFYFKRAKFIDPEKVNFKDYVGDFYSQELEVTYRFYLKENISFMSYKDHVDIPIIPVQLDEFGNNDRTLYRFLRDKHGKISQMELSSDGTVKNIQFKKVAH
jgi:CubicO group peptidase (beta-lactamase class C family)